MNSLMTVTLLLLACCLLGTSEAQISCYSCQAYNISGTVSYVGSTSCQNVTCVSEFENVTAYCYSFTYSGSVNSSQYSISAYGTVSFFGCDDSGQYCPSNTTNFAITDGVSFSGTNNLTCCNGTLCNTFSPNDGSTAGWSGCLMLLVLASELLIQRFFQTKH